MGANFEAVNPDPALTQSQGSTLSGKEQRGRESCLLTDDMTIKRDQTRVNRQAAEQTS